MPDRSFPAVEALARHVERVAADRPDPTIILAEVIRQIAASEADPYLVLGVLMEGAAHTLGHYIPPERQADTAAALVRTLIERMKAHGPAG